MHIHGLEKSSQDIPRYPGMETPLAISEPLHQLHSHAPHIKTRFSFEDVHFSFSNDEAAAYLDQTRARTMQPDYRRATNRTAVVVGESSLASALALIPEETIVVVDNSMAMCSFMNRYITSLRDADNIEEWSGLMGLEGPNTESERYAILRLIEQIKEWGATGYAHALNEEDAYTRAKKLAQEKAIIVWHGDIANKRGMKRLGKALRAHSANVTMMNLTNVFLADETFDDAAGFAGNLRQLPVTEHAPILTTSAKVKPSNHPFYPSRIVEATGPFFGLDNLAAHGGAGFDFENPGAYRRQYHESTNPLGDEVISGLAARALFSTLGANIRPGELDDLLQRGFVVAPTAIIVEGDAITEKDIPPEILRILRDLHP